MFDFKKQQELVASISYRDLILNLYLTQLIFIMITLVLSFLFDQSVKEWIDMISLDPLVLFGWGIPIAASVILIDLLLWRFLPEEWIDDGGINERIFSHCPLYHIPLLALVISCAEEILFRGMLQQHLGYLPASLLFALMHIRYLSKPVLFATATLISFVLGGVLMVTGNLLVPITVHFLIDSILGILIRFGWMTTRNKGTEGSDGEKREQHHDT